MMGNGFQGAMDPRMMMMQMQMQKQGPQGGTPMGPPGGMQQGMGMRSPNAPMAPPPQAQQPQNPMQGMNMQMLMEALKKRQGAPNPVAQVNATNTQAMTADPMAQGAAQAQQAQNMSPVQGFLKFLGIGS
jgi:hypothetical protein